jgi:hypothetical protein
MRHANSKTLFHSISGIKLMVQYSCFPGCDLQASPRTLLASSGLAGIVARASCIVDNSAQKSYRQAGLASRLLYSACGPTRSAALRAGASGAGHRSWGRPVDTQRDHSGADARYPILTFPEVPEVTIDLIDRPNEVPWGAGEPSAAVVPAAIGNAVFDAIGVRLRSVPFTPSKVKLAMGNA